MKRSWQFDYKGIATKVKNAGLSPAYQIKNCGASRECPKCHYVIDNSDVSQEWPRLPAGVKFDPSDVELLEHLAAKCRLGSSEPHTFIQEFIPTVEQEEGICYTHPENLPGAKKDGSSVHFFHKTMNAYATGRRKRRKICNQHSSTKEEVGWHKTGKTKPVMENGVRKGCKKILVLYTTSKKGSKPCKSNWIMHQYHLGTDEDEIEGRLVSKIFYQPQKQTDKTDSSYTIEESDRGTIQTSPLTPTTHTPEPPRPGKSVWRCDAIDDYLPLSSAQDAAEFVKETLSPPPSSAPPLKDNKMETYTWLAGESQVADGDGLDHDSLLCNKILDIDYSRLHDGINWSGHSELPKRLHDGLSDDLSRLENNNASIGDRNLPCGIAELENLEFDTPFDSQQLPNLLLTADHKTVKLADFGLAREESLTEMMTAETETYRWMAPELYSTVTLRHGEKKHYNHKNTRPSADNLPEELALLVTSCWWEDPNARPNFSQIIQMLLNYLSKVSPPEPVIPPRIFSPDNAVSPQDQSPGFHSLMPVRNESGGTQKTQMEKKKGGSFLCFGPCY